MEFDGVEDAEFFSKGRRGFIYIGKYKGKKVAIKCKNPESKAQGRILNEAKWIKRLNQQNIGPKLLFYCDDYLIYEFVEGMFIVDYVRECNKEDAIDIVKKVFEQCRTMDKLYVNKEEMLRPIKHILIGVNKKPVQLDFERANHTLKPKNVTQFAQFVFKSEFGEILESKGIVLNRKKLKESCIKYKKELSRIRFNEILSLMEG